MSAADNKQLLQAIFAELSKGNSRPLVESMADEVCWTVAGSTAWSGTYRGKPAVLQELLIPLGRRFAQPYRATAERFIAEGDTVAVEARGEATTRTGIAYNNRYCFLYRLADGKLREITEYCDTALIEAALGSRDHADA